MSIMPQLPNTIASILAKHPHGKLWLGVSVGVILTTIITSIYLFINTPKKSQDTLVTSIPEFSETESTALSNPDASSQSSSPYSVTSRSSTATSPASQPTSTTTTLAIGSPTKTLINELNTLDLDGLASRVDNLQKSVGQFNN